MRKRKQNMSRMDEAMWFGFRGGVVGFMVESTKREGPEKEKQQKSETSAKSAVLPHL